MTSDTERESKPRRCCPRCDCEALHVARAFFAAFVVAGLVLSIIYFDGLKDQFSIGLRFIRSLGVLQGAIVLCSANVIGALLFLPCLPFTLAAGFLYGIGIGSLVVTVASNVAAVISFLTARHLARSFVEKKLGGKGSKFRMIDSAIKKDAFRIIFLIRSSPIHPYGVANYLFGITSVSLFDFTVAGAIAMVPATVMEVYFGTAVKNVSDLVSGHVEDTAASRFFFYGGLLLTFVVTVVVTWWVKKKLDLELAASSTSDASSVSVSVASSSLSSSPHMSSASSTSLALTRDLDPDHDTDFGADDTDTTPMISLAPASVSVASASASHTPHHRSPSPMHGASISASDVVRDRLASVAALNAAVAASALATSRLTAASSSLVPSTSSVVAAVGMNSTLSSAAAASTSLSSRHSDNYLHGTAPSASSAGAGSAKETVHLLSAGADEDTGDEDSDRDHHNSASAGNGAGAHNSNPHSSTHNHSHPPSSNPHSAIGGGGSGTGSSKQSGGSDKDKRRSGGFLSALFG